MTPRRARTLTAIFFALYLVALTWPGVLPFNRIRPFVLGVPFAFAWVAGWVAAGGLVLWWLHRVEQRHRSAGGD